MEQHSRRKTEQRGRFSGAAAKSEAASGQTKSYLIYMHACNCSIHGCVCRCTKCMCSCVRESVRKCVHAWYTDRLRLRHREIYNDTQYIRTHTHTHTHTHVYTHIPKALVGYEARLADTPRTADSVTVPFRKAFAHHSLTHVRGGRRKWWGGVGRGERN
jgi:hypothetical protein